MTAATDSAMIEVVDLKVHFAVAGGLFTRRGAGVVKAVDGVSFAIRRGETLGLVGESGCGKSTVGRAIVGLAEATAGSVRFQGEDLAALQGERRRVARRHIQLIFQDPYASLNPRMTVAQILAEPLLIHRLRDGADAMRGRVVELLDLVGMSRHHGERYPHELSGGQRQRVGIARSLACEPDIIVCDEPVSALDVSIQAQVINLLQELQQRLGLTYLFIAHGLGVIRHISDRVAVMYLGRIVEIGDKTTIYRRPAHPYTRALMSASPVPDPRVERTRRRIILAGDVPNPLAPPPGCRFSSRCPVAIARCRDEEPSLEPQGGAGHLAACWRSAELDAAMSAAAERTSRVTAGG